MADHQMMIVTRTTQRHQVGIDQLERWEQMERFDVMHVQHDLSAGDRMKN